MLILLTIIVLIASIILHEVSHGLMADRLGDPTPRMQGRLTLNPIKHIDPVGSILVPIFTSLLGFTFGWAKPVEYNPYNLKNKRIGEFLIALAGPSSNIIIAIIFSVLIRILMNGSMVITPFIEFVITIVIINLILAIFNLIPIPPLDGSKLLFAFLPNQYGKFRRFLELYAPFLIIFVIFFLWKAISPFVVMIFRLLTGISL